MFARQRGRFRETPASRNARVQLELVLERLYDLAGGDIDGGDVRAAKLTTAQRIGLFDSVAFRNWIYFENMAGRQVFWLKDVDMTQAAGDIFTFFFKWRADNDKFSTEQIRALNEFLVGKNLIGRSIGKRAPYKVLELWESKERGGEGLSLLDFWAGAYWPSQIGLTREEKLAQVSRFAPHYRGRIYPGVRKENRLLEEVGVHVVIVSYGDQELAAAVAPYLGIKPENSVGAALRYDAGGTASGAKISYEMFDSDWARRPQPGKPLSFHYWLNANRQRWGWQHVNHRKFVIAGRDGDSASSDGGMMIHLMPPALGNFMVDTPGKPDRIEKFYSVAAKYGWGPGQFFTLAQKASQLGNEP